MSAGMTTLIEVGYPCVLSLFYVVGAVVATGYVRDAQTPDMPKLIADRLLDPTIDQAETMPITRAAVRWAVQTYRAQFAAETPAPPRWQVVLYGHVLPGLRRMMPGQTVGRHHVGGAR